MARTVAWTATQQNFHYQERHPGILSVARGCPRRLSRSIRGGDSGVFRVTFLNTTRRERVMSTGITASSSPHATLVPAPPATELTPKQLCCVSLPPDFRTTADITAGTISLDKSARRR